jgi:hypothetical protein
MDYLTIIQNGANWKYFEGVFRRKQDLQNHLEKFSDYRNCLMHSRPMTGLTKTLGKAVLMWLQEVLAAGQHTAGVEGNE